MANTSFLRYQVEPWVRQQLASRYSLAFSSEVLPLRSGGRHEFDAVSADGRVVAAIKTSSGLTSGGRIPSGKINACTADLYYLSLVEAEDRILILTDPEFHQIFLRRMAGAIAPEITVELMPLPTRLQGQVDRVRQAASHEMKRQPVESAAPTEPRHAGRVETAIRATVRKGTVLKTPTRSAQFVVDLIDENGIVLLFGAKRTPTRLTWDCLEGVPSFLDGRGWVTIGTRYDVEGNVGTLDEYLKQFTKRGTAAWVAALLEIAGLVRIDRSRPARLSLLL